MRSKSVIMHRKQRWERTRDLGWQARKDVDSASALNIMEAWEDIKDDLDVNPDRLQAHLFKAGLIYSGEVIAISTCKNPATGCIRLSVYVSMVK